ncbi:SDR family NAD(P)-dependent oxidoreductase [Pseudohongiella sp.]|uniref:Short-chain dehydrogenase/reductase SDR n=1 Tax=marine sediment metagenome TaxID=412755 RepID=A0A0F9W7J0_9ZZZZ|nr:SDR family NAD(P)-dependent oxidoreductase [Pseudohongiella sp.]HDZ09457.1 SDR family NAD(P)-dependent oxidoreductase [Pseudohongiella sp.]HEA63712.1 SDR family NAD(P)-dependent oxidoreductase [Pseudohongiella sp.]
MSTTQQRQANLIIGAGSGIGGAVIKRLVDDQPDADILAVSRHPPMLPDELAQRVQTFTCDYSEAGIKDLVQQLTPWYGQIRLVVISTGVLHTDTIRPEKRAEDLSMSSMLEVLRINTVIPSLWLMTLLPALGGSTPCRMLTLSARVGSISDNHKGGWYSYRASKAALNMVVKTAAIEYARRAPNVKLVAFHPGTVDTALSKPFQRNVPEGKLFSADFVAERLLTISSDLPVDGDASYLDWAAETISW